MITNEMKKALEPLIIAFNYRQDSERYGVKEYWTTIPLSKIMECNCENFSLTVLKTLAGGTKWGMFKLLLTKKAKLHYIRVPIKGGDSEGHCVLEFNGMFTDNNFRAWVDKEVMLRKLSYRFKYRYTIPLIGVNYIWAKIVSVKNKITA